MDVVEVAKSAKNASVALAAVKDDVKNGALAEIAKVLRARSQQIVSANKEDLTAAENNNLAAF